MTMTTVPLNKRGKGGGGAVVKELSCLCSKHWFRERLPGYITFQLSVLEQHPDTLFQGAGNIE